VDVLREELGTDVDLIKGRGGIFDVRVDGRTVVKKTIDGFPTEDEIVAAVRAGLG
jgi:selenoprotein W-related protein